MQSAVCSAVLVTTTAPGLDMYSNTFMYIHNNVLHGLLSFMGVLPHTALRKQQMVPLGHSAHNIPHEALQVIEIAV